MERLSHIRLRRLTRGFTLTEVAIVLGIVGVVLGGIWSYAGSMNDKVKQQRFSEMLTSIIGNVRGHYAGKTFFESTNVNSMMPILTDRGIFPGDTVHKSGTFSVVTSPFGDFTNPLDATYKSLYVCGWRSTGSTHCDFNPVVGDANVPLFAIEALLPRGNACIVGALRNSNAVSLPGLVAVYINNKNMNGDTVNGVNLTLPMSLAMAAAACNQDVNRVDFVFKLIP